MRPRFAVAKIDYARIRLVKLDVEIVQHRVPKPRNVAGRSPHQLIVRTQPMLIDKLLQIRLRNQFFRWLPDKFAAELKLAHTRSLLRASRASKPIGERTLAACWLPHSAAPNFQRCFQSRGELSHNEKFAIAERDRQHGTTVRSPELAITSVARAEFVGRFQLQFSS
jgi:hypothetical protein